MADIKMVSNSEDNHLDALKKLFIQKANRILIASPYLAKNLKSLLNEFNFENIESVELITTFKVNDPEQINKPQTLKTYFEFFSTNYPDVKIKLHIDNLLHGKIYVSTKEETHIAILGSANFTRRGLCDNHEWGVLIKEDEVIDNIIEDLYSSIEYEDVTYNQIKKACLFADQYERDNSDWNKQPEITGDFLKKIYSVDDSENLEPNYFLKPIGVSDNPVLLEDKRNFSDIHQNLHFSKKKPSGVRKGDIVITVGVGGGALLTYFKVTGGLERATDNEIKKDAWKERWPWFMEGRNQAPEFSGEWWEHNLQVSVLLEKFLKKYTAIPVTKAGGFGLGTLNFGSDKVRITKEFGDFLIENIAEIKSV